MPAGTRKSIHVLKLFTTIYIRCCKVDKLKVEYDRKNFKTQNCKRHSLIGVHLFVQLHTDSHMF